MNIELSTPALLFPAIAILMLGYVNRYVGAANVIRNFKKDYDSGYKHNKITEQLRVLSVRIDIFRSMLSLGALALIFACSSMFLIYLEFRRVGNVTFGLSLVSMAFSLLLSLYETSLSNNSLHIEIDDMLDKEKETKTKHQK